MSDRSAGRRGPTLPQGVGLAVLVIVVISIGVVLAAAFLIPDSERPTFVPGTTYSTVTITSTPTPSR